MYKSSPQSNDYDLILKLQKINRYIYYFIILLSVITYVLTKKYFEDHEAATNFRNIFYLASIIGYGTLSIIVDYVLLPAAQRKTRCDFFDNAFGTKYIPNQNSEEYYTNDNIENGIYKMAVNLFESSFFTLKISSKMRLKKIVKCALLVALLIPLAFFGFKSTWLLTISIFQVLLSVYFIGGLIRLLIFVERTRKYFEELQNLFSNTDFKTEILKYEPTVIRIYTDYESNKAWSYINLDSKIYKELNPSLMKDWDEMKVKYSIV